MIGGIPVRKSSLVPLYDPEGEPLLFMRVEDTILVHPDRWDEFQLWSRQPDVADHPDVRAIFRQQDTKPPPPTSIPGPGRERGPKR